MIMKRLSVILVSCVFVNLMKAQVYVSPNATLFVDTNAVLAVIGDAKNDGIIENPGTIQLKGDFDNQKSFNSKGNFVLMGLNQTVYHKNNVISTLICNGGGIKNFTNSISISKSLELNEGLIKPIDTSVFLLKNTASTTLGNTDSYIDGVLYTEGLNSRYFPIGKGGLFAPSECQGVKGDSSIIYGMEVVNPTTLDLQKGKRVQNLLSSRYWKMNVKSGAFEHAYLSLSYSNDDAFADNTMVGVTQATDSVGPYDMSFDLLHKNEITSKISSTGLLYTTSMKPITKRYFTLGDYLFADMKLFFLPNALSKNAADTNNRAIRVYGGVFEKTGFSFVVSNQWGNVVYKTNSVVEMAEKGWDGTNSRTNRRETTGQYFYIIKGTTLSGDSFEKAGSIWIID